MLMQNALDWLINKINVAKILRSKSQTCLFVLYDNCLQVVLRFIKKSRSSIKI